MPEEQGGWRRAEGAARWLGAARRRRGVRRAVKLSIGVVVMLAGLMPAAVGTSTAAAGGQSSAGGQSCANTAYTSNSNENTVSVIDTRTNTEIVTIPVGTAPVNPTFTPDGRHVYVPNSQGGDISVIEVSTNTVVATLPAGGPRPLDLAFTPDGKELVITLLGPGFEDPGTMRIMDVATGTLSDPIPVGASPMRLALSPDGKAAYVVNEEAEPPVGDSMSVIDLERRQVVDTIFFDEEPFNLLVSPDGKRVYVGVVFSDYVAVIDTGTNTVVDEIPSPSPNGLAFSRDRRSIFVTNVFDDTMQEISLAQGEVVRTVDAGPLPGYIEVTQNGQQAYVVRPFGSDVSVVDTATLAIVDTVTVGNTANSTPTVVAVCHGPS